MKRTLVRTLASVLVLALAGFFAHAQERNTGSAKITVDVGKPAHTISPTLFGIFFEDINMSADGGIYPEFVRNRSFEDADTLQNWVFVSADGKSSASISNADVYARPPIPPLNPLRIFR